MMSEAKWSDPEMNVSRPTEKAEHQDLCETKADVISEAKLSEPEMNVSRPTEKAEHQDLCETKAYMTSEAKWSDPEMNVSRPTEKAEHQDLCETKADMTSEAKWLDPEMNVSRPTEKAEHQDLCETKADMTSDEMWSDPEMKNLEELDIFNRPLCLISSDKDGQLSIEEETMSQLEKIQRIVNVVGIAGLYRTGKSYLMNRLAYANSGFSLGNTTESKTKGIWIWCKEHPTQKHQILVLLDTEGLGDVLKGNTDHDNRIFTLTALLSSTLVYNMMGAFNQDSIEKLTTTTTTITTLYNNKSQASSFITEMSKNMKLGDGMGNDNNFDFVLPKFVLCLRDFLLQPVHDGKPITPDEYLEVCLRSRQIATLEDEKFNRPRECIRKYFTRRKVFTFDRPGGRKVMSKLEETHDSDLSEEFVADTMKFTSFIFQCEPKMLVNRQHVTGSMLANLAREYVKAMRENSIPCVDDAMTIMSKIENEKAVKKAVAHFDKEMKTLQLPMHSNKEFLEARFKFQKSVLISLNKCLVFDDKNEAEKSAETQMEKIAAEIEQKNVEMLQKLCRDKLTELYTPIKNSITNRIYKVAGGYKTYKEDISTLEEKFNDELRIVDQTERQNALNSFLAGIKKDGDTILSNDNKISKEENEKKLKETKEMAEKRQNVLLQQLKEQREAHEREMERNREEQRRREEANLIAMRNELLQARGINQNNIWRENERLRLEDNRGVFTRAWQFLFG